MTRYMDLIKDWKNEYGDVNDPEYIEGVNSLIKEKIKVNRGLKGDKNKNIINYLIYSGYFDK